MDAAGLQRNARYAYVWAVAYGLSAAMLLLCAGMLWATQPSASMRGDVSADAPVEGAASEPSDRDAAGDAGQTLNEAGKRATRIREGTLLSAQAGYFIASEGRYDFQFADGGSKLRVLENLALERVVRKLGESPRRLEWKVSGIVTEFQGTNFLLLQRVTISSGSARPHAPAAPPTGAVPATESATLSE